MNVIEASDICKAYGSLQVLKGISLCVAKGELVTLVGPSGSGKSTLLHIIGSLDRADSGDVLINGTKIQGMSDRQISAFRNKHIGFVFQFHHLLPEFSALENVCMPAMVAGMGRKEALPEAEKWLKRLGLEGRMQHKLNELSGGEQQRVAVARALMNRPDVILADEPSGNLDSKNAKELHQLFLDLRKETGQTFLIVTHNEEFAELSDRKIYLSDGRLA
jgi:lipoprotein-releasing system ATP-binding protein